ncbi:hypothetical protein [Bacillus alkalicellulosilyticus]|uniref:hypothetical protein n=1 Tax=Alkalihalobacterium alkalicellulosilyticum TaxID=1912214 RepID=UPI00099709F5|nr:hypothetical protein [Bacillus alkalicellulosilyticus]
MAEQFPDFKRELDKIDVPTDKLDSIIEQTVKQKRMKMTWIKGVTVAACLVLAVLVVINIPNGGNTSAYGVTLIDSDGTKITLDDIGLTREELGTSVRQVNSRPDLQFFIEGENIAKIEISTEKEYLDAVDWTETQHEKYWDIEYTSYFDEEKQIRIHDWDSIYEKEITMTFSEDFNEYDKIWYRWDAWNLYKWAASDNFSQFLGYGIPVDDFNPEEFDNLSPEEQAEIAAGSPTSAEGHIQLGDYPEHLREDTITITITDHKGKVTKKYIHVKVSNNALRQTVVTAYVTEAK